MIWQIVFIITFSSICFAPCQCLLDDLFDYFLPDDDSNNRCYKVKDIGNINNIIESVNKPDFNLEMELEKHITGSGTAAKIDEEAVKRDITNSFKKMMKTYYKALQEKLRDANKDIIYKIVPCDKM